MQLELDPRIEFYRGPHAVHVLPHKKLGGKHCTVSNEALALVQYLVRLDQVRTVTFKKVFGGSRFIRRIHHKKEMTNKVEFMLVGDKTAQVIRVSLVDAGIRDRFIAKVEQKWMRQRREINSAPL